ncbi:hypothetical protein FW800_11170 [Pseudomonas sp. 910_23]
MQPENVGAGLRFFVGASLLAKNAQAPRLIRNHALSMTSFASKLAPTLRVVFTCPCAHPWSFGARPGTAVPQDQNDQSRP